MSSSTLKTVGRRLLEAVPTLLGIILVTFLLTRALPGDPAAFYAGPAADEQSIAQVRTAMGLDQPLPVQFGHYAAGLMRGDWGVSMNTGQPIIEELQRRLPASLELTLYGLALAVLVAVPLGVLAATRPNSWVDHLCRVLVTAGVSMPVFFTGLLLVYVFYYQLGWAPAPTGRMSLMAIPPDTVTGMLLIDSILTANVEAFVDSLRHLALPVITLALFALAPIARMTRGSMISVLESDYIRTARASGLSPRTILFTYALRHAMLSVLTTLGMVFSFLLGANVLVEQVFSWPGIGSFAVNALVSSDYAAIQGFVLSMALLFVSLNLLIDLLYAVIDPRVGGDQ
ncbi:ABC transporter permease [Aquisalimonas asiatica]|uniref:Peptide/nickel transport system permease protein n=1 Tax=Aquisalimonas asiatica TaxID=406100 RepID=A0A1H8S5H4_9GAMM|nr:ABC transporter permease [Aquisalimonas asiatica]SEO73568.1 peptide/nickel transport system permease protein [Aquisalimonas asiatica]